jgi:hypothetical protein
MELKDHCGPVYALHRVFTLNDVDWPRLDARDDECENAALEEPCGQIQTSTGRVTPSRSAS